MRKLSTSKKSAVAALTLAVLLGMSGPAALAKNGVEDGGASHSSSSSSKSSKSKSDKSNKSSSSSKSKSSARSSADDGARQARHTGLDSARDMAERGGVGTVGEDNPARHNNGLGEDNANRTNDDNGISGREAEVRGTSDSEGNADQMTNGDNGQTAHAAEVEAAETESAGGEREAVGFGARADENAGFFGRVMSFFKNLF